MTEQIRVFAGGGTTLFTSPSQVPVASTELWPVVVDFSALILAGDVLSAPVTVLHTGDGGTVTLADAPTLPADGISVQQEIRGSALTVGQTYRLDVTVTMSAVKKLTASTNIYCPY